MTIAAVVDRIAEDPGRAKILLAQHVGSSPLQDRRAVALQEATHLVIAASEPHLRPEADETALRMDTLVAVGGFVELITAWHAGLLDVIQGGDRGAHESACRDARRTLFGRRRWPLMLYSGVHVFSPE